MNKIKKRWLGNAGVNVAGGVVTSVFNIVLPAILSRNLSQNDFSVWSLILQVVLYVQVFSGGMQTAISKYISNANELKDEQDQINTIGAAWRVSYIATGLGCIVALICAWVFPYFFSIINDLNVQFCIVIIGFGAAFQLLALVPAGVFIGRHENITWIITQSASRCLIIFIIFIVARINANLLSFAFAFAFGGVIVIPASYYFLFKKYRVLFGLLKTTKKRLRDLSSYCITMGFWNLSVLLIGGFSIALVGFYEPSSVGVYALAVTVVNIINGFLQAILSPIVVNSAAIMTLDDGAHRVFGILSKITKVLVWALMCFCVIYFFIGELFLNLWVGINYSKNVFPLLLILIFSNSVRSIFLPVSMVLLAIKTPKSGLISTLFEGGVVLLGSIVLGSKFGALGIAYATLIGAFVGCFFTYNYVMKEIESVIILRRKFVLKNILIPLSSMTLFVFIALLY